jgi:hypothetical protein
MSWAAMDAHKEKSKKVVPRMYLLTVAMYPHQRLAMTALVGGRYQKRGRDGNTDYCSGDGAVRRYCTAELMDYYTME